MKTISVVFSGYGMQYTYMTDDETIEVGDHVVVFSGEYKVVQVNEVHETPQLSGPYNYTWIVQKVDTTNYDANIKADHDGHPSAGKRL